MMLLPLRLCGLLALAASTNAARQFRLANQEKETRLPKAMSDMSAVVGPDNLIYLAGGCDSPFGSQYNEEAGAFRCNSVSNSFYSFDPETEEFTVLPAMPEARYRHAAVAINNQIWLVGGRDVDDELVGNVHVYDLEDMRWRTFRDLHPTYWLSDLGGFSARGQAYFVGGFTHAYRALRKVWSIDPVSSWETGTLQVVRHANLVQRRGDVGVVVDADERFAYVSGGSTHENNFCSPLNSVEEYDLIFNHWYEMPPLQTGRTGKTVIQLNDQLVALGGAQQIRKLCNKTTSDPSDMQTPVYEVEVYDEDGWYVVDSLSDYRFRSTTVVFNNTVYSFGGQSVYFSVCMCHPTLDAVVTYEQTPSITQPGGLINGNTYNFEFQNPGQQQETEDTQPENLYNDSPEYYVPPATDTDTASPPAQETVSDPQDIDERGFGQNQDDPPYAEDKPSDQGEARDYQSESTGFGGYHRDPNGLHSGSSSFRKVCTSFLYAFTVGMVAAVAL